MSKDACAVANHLLALAKQGDRPLTPMQLIKLVYVAHGWSLAWYDRPLIGDDVLAWRYGPVIRRVYDAFKQYGRNPIERPTYGYYDLAFDIGLMDDDGSILKPEPISANFSSQEKHVMNEVYRAYGALSGIDLSRLTHLPDSPWDKTVKKSSVNAVIDEQLIKEHFKTLDRHYRERPAAG